MNRSPTVLILLAVSWLGGCGSTKKPDCLVDGCVGGKFCNPNTGVCLVDTSGTGGGSGAGGGTGGATCANCTGCCLNGVCKVGSAAAACGSGGTACDICSGQETCTAGICKLSCDNTTCPNGCCSQGACKPGIGDAECGSGGGPCSVCAATRECRSQTCVQVVSVTMRYQYISSGACPNAFCMLTQKMTPSAYEALLPSYPPPCVVTEPTASERLINCGPSCGTCSCAPPAYCKISQCSWTPP